MVKFMKKAGGANGHEMTGAPGAVPGPRFPPVPGPRFPCATTASVEELNPPIPPPIHTTAHPPPTRPPTRPPVSTLNDAVHEVAVPPPHTHTRTHLYASFMMHFMRWWSPPTPPVCILHDAVHEVVAPELE